MSTLIPLVAVLLMMGTGIAIIVSGGIASAALGGAADDRRRSAGTVVRRFRQILGWSLIAVSGLGILAIVPIAAMPTLRNIEWVFAAVGLGILSTVLAVAGLIQIRVLRKLDTELSPEKTARVERRLSVLRVLGWMLVLVPISAVLFPMVIPALLVGWAFVAWLGSRRRGRQGTLLWMLTIAVERGWPLAEEIESLAAGLRGRSRSQLVRLAELLRTGLPLVEALEHCPGLLPHSAVVAAHVGTENGTLAQSLREAAVRHTQQRRWLWWGASSPTLLVLYLLIVPSIAVAIVAFQMYYIVPKFKAIFNDFGIELPVVTQQLVDLSDFTVDNFFLISPLWGLPLAGLVLAAVGYVRGWGELDIPLVSRWFTRYDTPGILRNLAETIAAGRPLDDVLPLIAANHRRRHIRKRLNAVVRHVQGGGNAWEAMHRAGLINHREVALLESAERLGNLPWALHELADAIQRRSRYRWLTLFEFLQPVIVIGIALWVCFVCIAMFLPLIKLLNDLS